MSNANLRNIVVFVGGVHVQARVFRDVVIASGIMVVYSKVTGPCGSLPFQYVIAIFKLAIAWR
jgi:hypothetical protein